MTDMNRTQLIEEIARRTRTTRNPLRRRDVQQVLDLFLELVTEELGKPGGRVGLAGLGSLEVQSFRVGGQLQDIATGEPLELSPSLRYRIRFKAARSLKETLRQHPASEVNVPVD